MSDNVARCALGISTETISAWRSQLLSSQEQGRISGHIPTCLTCQRRLQRFERIAQALRTQTVPPSGVKLWRSVQIAIATSERRNMFSAQEVFFGGLVTATLIALLAVAVFIDIGHGNSSQTEQPTAIVTSTAPATTTTTNVPLIQVSASKSVVDATTPNLKVTAQCPGDRVMVGGGFTTQLSTRHDQFLYFTANYPSAVNAWTAGIENNQDGEQVTLTTYATCLKSNATVTTKIIHATPDSNGIATAMCPTNSALLSGGYQMTGIGLSLMIYSKPVEGGWQTRIIGNGPPYQAYAVCATAGLNQKIINTATTTIATNSLGNVSAPCDGTQILTGGGFSLVGQLNTLVQQWYALRNSSDNRQFSASLYPVGNTNVGEPPPSSQLTVYSVCALSTPKPTSTAIVAIKPDCSNYPKDTNIVLYGNIPLPAGTIVGAAFTGAGTYSEYVCTPNGTETSINTAMITTLTQNGWAQITPQNAPACLRGKSDSGWLKNGFLITWEFSLPGQETWVQGAPTWAIKGVSTSEFGC